MKLTQGVIIDVDGTLVDSNEARAQAWVESFGRADYRVPYAGVRKLIGLPAHEVLIRTIGIGADTPTGQLIYDGYLKLFRERFLQRLVPFYRARDLVDRLTRSGLRLAVLSHDPPDILLEVLRIAGAENLFYRAGTPTGVPGMASQRDVIKAALDRLGASPPHVLMIADSPFDIEAAASLNVPVIGLESGGWAHGDLTRALSAYADVSDLLNQIRTSPIMALLTVGQPTSLSP